MRYHIIYDDDKEWFCEDSYEALNEFAVCKLCGQYQRISKVVKGVR